jgi:hypothetical protein
VIERTGRRSLAARPIAPYVERFVERIRDAEKDLEREIKERQHRWQYRVRRGRVWFDRELRETHRRLRQSIAAYVLEGDGPLPSAACRADPAG